MEDLLIGVFHHLLSSDIAVSGCSPCEEKSEEVIDFRSRADRGSRVAVHRFLLDADDGAESLDFIHIRPFESSDEIPCVGGEGLNIPSLPFGIDGVEGEARLSRATESGNDGELVARNGDIDVFEVVHPCPYDLDDVILLHSAVMPIVDVIHVSYMGDSEYL